MTNKKIKDEDIKEEPEVQKECPVSITKLKEYYDIMIESYSKYHRKMAFLNAIASGDFWKALKTKYPSYQILPDTNYVSYVQSNLVASLYSVAKSPSILATNKLDVDLITNLNLILQKEWSLKNIGQFEMACGCNAALQNVGYTYTAWSNNPIDDPYGDGGDIVFKNISPLKFMRDPFSIDLDHAGHCVYYERYNKSYFEASKKYKIKFKEFLSKSKDNIIPNTPDINYNGAETPKADYYTLFIYWVRRGSKIYEIHVINNEAILFWKDLKPAVFPIASLYCELPTDDNLIGLSPCAKVVANYAAYNIINSLMLTAEYRNQNPPRFIMHGSGLNLEGFSKWGGEANKTFVVKMPADKAVHYQTFPNMSPNVPNMLNSLKYDTQLISGVDGRYTGRDTGSIITTGGTEEMLNRVTLIDSPKIVNYENYAKTLSKLIIMNLIEYAPSRKYFVKDAKQPKVYKEIVVDFPKIKKEHGSTIFDYELIISTDLPNNKYKMAEMANMLMEKQMQYRKEGEQVELITTEEWLRFQDIPFKEEMLERMGVQRMSDSLEEAAQVIYQYAALTQKGMAPDDAMYAAADALNKKRQGLLANPSDLEGMIGQGGQGPGMMSNLPPEIMNPQI